MAEVMSSGEEANGNSEMVRPRAKHVETQYFSTARTAPRAPNESRIGTDEAHERLQAARNRALRDPMNIRLDDVSADH
jgi:hypothetical protein